MAWPGRSNREIGLQVSRPPNFTAVKAGLSSYAFVLLAILRVFSREREREREPSSLDSLPPSPSSFLSIGNRAREIPEYRKISRVDSVAKKFEELSLEFSC